MTLPPQFETTNYWDMSDDELAASWRTIAAIDPAFGDDDYLETLNFIEDAILQRIGAPEFASGDEPEWQNKIRAFGETH